MDLFPVKVRPHVKMACGVDKTKQIMIFTRFSFIYRLDLWMPFGKYYVISSIFKA